MDINNHADKTMLGSNCLSLHSFEILVDVYVLETSPGSVEWSTIYGAISYYHPISGNIYMLVYHQVIHCPRLENHLTCPMQIPMAGVRINELPFFFAEDTDEKTHAIIVDDPLNPNQPLIIMLVLKGVTSYFPYRKPRASDQPRE